MAVADAGMATGTMSLSEVSNQNERMHILHNRHQYSEDLASSIESNENAFDDMKQLINNDSDEKLNTLPMASFNYINSIIGSGVIGIPYALHQAGFGLGLFLLILVAVVTDYSLILMVRSGHLCGQYSYQGIMESAYGKSGYILLGILQFMYPFIAMISYNVVVGDTVTKVIVRVTGLEPDSLFAKREIIVLIATVLITIPLCLYRDIAKLARISFLSLLCVAFILFAILLRMGRMSEVVPAHPDSWKFANWDIIPAIGIMAFAFMCHHNTFLLYTSIENASQERWDKITHLSLFTSLLVAGIFGVSGYATFTDWSQGDLLENYCWDDDLMNLSRILFSGTILLTYPIECLVTRQVIEHTFFSSAPEPGFTSFGNDNPPIDDYVTSYRHYIVTIGIIGLTYIISIATDCLGVVLELNGVLAAVPLAYVLPAITYLKLEEGSLLSKRKLPALLLLIFGLTVAILGVLFLMIDLDSVDTCSHGKVMPYCNRADVNISKVY